DAGSGEQLQRAQLVARAADRLAVDERVHVHHLELADHRGAVEGVAGSDAGNDGIEFQLFAPIANSRSGAGDVHVAAQVVDHPYLMAACFGRFHQAAGRIERCLAREDADPHDHSSARNERPGSTRNRRANDLRPSSIRKPISSRRVRLISVTHVKDAQVTRVRITGLISLLPPGLRTGRSSTTSATAITAPRRVRWSGWISKPTISLEPEVKRFRAKACREDEAAPVSTLTLMASTPRSGSPTHSRHPIVGSGFIAGNSGSRPPLPARW